MASIGIIASGLTGITTAYNEEEVRSLSCRPWTPENLRKFMS
jgi:hypothetical protein